MKLLSDPSIALIEQKIKGEDTIAAVGSTSNTSNDGKTDESIKRKQLCSQLSQYCVAKQAASKFQVCNITYEVSIYICLLFLHNRIVSRKRFRNSLLSIYIGCQSSFI